MNSCIRCGMKLSHNYLKAVVTFINKERRRVLVCLKCKEIIEKRVVNLTNKDDEAKDGVFKQKEERSVV